MKSRVLKVIFIVILLVLILYGYYFLNLYYNFSIPCLFREVTGYYCPGCGITRCLFSIINGNFYQAFCYNRLVFISLPFLGFYVVYSIYLYVFNKNDKIICRVPKVVWNLLLVVVILFGVVRNIY